MTAATESNAQTPRGDRALWLPTGAELDRIAGTNNYGRRILRRWKGEGRISGGAALTRDERKAIGA
ncbi:hypothetical protein [Saccharomonospora viridis]|uniref:hypothetical protein n=1 Tax=Saccharomonospora viridis TaxID=1852 RepID=UPI0024A7C42F|nr:hypothetical protein [Saccharomonospora viridis]